MDERLARTIEALREVGADWAVLSSGDSIAYSLGYAPPVETGFSPFAAGPNLAVVGRDGSAAVLALEGEAGCVREGEILRYDGYGHTTASSPESPYLEAFTSLLQRLGAGGVIAIEHSTLPASIAAGLTSTRTVDIGPALRRQRMTKTPAELDALRRAAEVAAAGQRRLLEVV